MPAEDEVLLTPAETAAMWKVDPKTVTRWAKAGKITSIRTLGGHRRYRKSEVLALMAVPETPPDPLRASVAMLWGSDATGPAATAKRKLLGAQIATVGQLAGQSAEDLAALGIRGAALDEVRLALARRGLALRGEVLGKVALRPPASERSNPPAAPSDARPGDPSVNERILP